MLPNSIAASHAPPELQVTASIAGEIQSWLRDLGFALGFDVWIASNDRSRVVGGVPLSRGCRDAHPAEIESSPGAEVIRLIDVLWIRNDDERVVAAFEVEHTTSIYTGIVRLLDLALGPPATPPMDSFSSLRTNGRRMFERN